MNVKVQLTRQDGSGLVVNNRLARGGDIMSLPASEAKELLQRRDAILFIRVRVLQPLFHGVRTWEPGMVFDAPFEVAQSFQESGYVAMCRLKVASQFATIDGRSLSKGDTTEVPLSDVFHLFECGAVEWAEPETP